QGALGAGEGAKDLVWTVGPKELIHVGFGIRTVFGVHLDVEDLRESVSPVGGTESTNVLEDGVHGIFWPVFDCVPHLRPRQRAHDIVRREHRRLEARLAVAPAGRLGGKGEYGLRREGLDLLTPGATNDLRLDEL